MVYSPVNPDVIVSKKHPKSLFLQDGREGGREEEGNIGRREERKRKATVSLTGDNLSWASKCPKGPHAPRDRILLA